MRPCLVALGLFTVLAASAQGLSTQRYLDLCRDRTSSAWNEIGHWLCPTYLRGLIEGATLQALQAIGSVEAARAVRTICEPAESTADAAITIVVVYAGQRPATHQQPIEATAYRALAEAWPCR